MLRKNLILAFCFLFFLAYAPLFARTNQVSVSRGGSYSSTVKKYYSSRNAPLVQYFIAPEDVIEIFIWQYPDFSRDVTVGTDGVISHPLLGRIRVAGLAVSKLEKIVQDKLSGYVNFISPGDSVEIYVWQSPELSKTVNVEPDGQIAHPLLGRMYVVGLTPAQLEERIKDRLSDYLKFISLGDSLEIYVWQNPDLTKSVSVGNEGEIAYPLLGRIYAVGLTPAQLEEKIQEGLSEYIKYPQVTVTMSKKASDRVSVLLPKKPVGRATVSIKEFSGSKIVVLGEISAPGVYNYTGGIDLIELIALAGDFTEKARTDSIMVVRGNFSRNSEVFRVNASRMIKQGAVAGDIVLQPNDVVYVPRSFIGNFNKFLENLRPTIDAVNTVMGIGTSGKTTNK